MNALIVLLAHCLSSLAFAPPSEGPARAEDAERTRVRVALLPAQIQGSLTPADQERLDQRLRAAFDHADISLVPARTVAAALEQQDGCTRDACLQELAEQLRADFVVTTEVEARSRDYRVVFGVVEANPSFEVSRVELDCPVCGAHEVIDLVGAKAHVVRDRILIDNDPARLSVEGEPRGASVELDGRRIGRLPFTGTIPPGEHELAITAPGYYEEVMPLVAIAGAEEQLAVTLRAKPRTAWHRPVGWTALGLGGLGIGAGVALLAIHERPYGPRCEDPRNIDLDGDCKWEYQTLGPGVALTVVGSTLVGLGTGLLVVDRRRREHGGTLDDSKAELRMRLKISPTSLGLRLEL